MPDLHYEHPRLAAIYDLDSGWSKDRDFYLALAGAGRKRILDLGCGTGLLCDAYAAEGHDVTGADPSAAMLDVGRRKPNGDKIEWVQSFAQNFRSAKRFDLIIMTGHAFQVLLDDTDVLATFATMRDHLAPDGLIVFESRNPAIDWRLRWHGNEDEFEVDGLAIRQTCEVLSVAGDRIVFETRYAFPDEVLVSLSELRFRSRTEIEAGLQVSGLQAKKICGDWDGALFVSDSSDEMIFFVGCG
ncbi:class I SAM-dependent methyltransferase [Rhizobium sp. BK376]|uniref:class I SAM-dependent methyltransferase n=1 Tax=Rhizobium sp. BK376 TaxID=2512149 RepID=UPI0010516CB9|nr:class I SAM-dependent methyltransferase [Rhizobium sp. BK376]TCR92128.1 methyltransferase family protein [Rhizobium sp. BK376]